MWTGVQAEHLTPTGIALLVDFESLRRYVTILIIVAREMWPVTGANETFTFSTMGINASQRSYLELSAQTKIEEGLPSWDEGVL